MTSSSRILQFFTTVRTAGFFKRLFSWKSIVGEADGAEAEYNASTSETTSRIQNAESRVTVAEEKVTSLQKQLEDTNRMNSSRVAELSTRSSLLDSQLREEQSKSRRAEEALYQEQIKHSSDADEAKKVSEELADLKNEYQSLRDLNIQLGEQNKSIKETESKLTRLQTESEELKTLVHKLESDLALEKETSRIQKEQNADLQQKFDELSVSHQAARDNLTKITEQYKSESERASQETEKNTTLSGELASLKTEYQSLRDRSIQLEEQNKTVKDAESKLTRLQTESEELKTLVHKLESDLALEKENNRHQKELNEDLEQKFENLSTEHQTVRDKLTAVTEQYKSESERASQESKKNTTLSTELDTLKEQLTKEKTEKVSESNRYLGLKKEFDEVNIELSEAKSKIAADESVKEEQKMEYDRRVETLNTALKQADDQRKENELKAEELRIANEKEMARTWQRHETEVAETLNSIAKRYEFNLCKKSEYPYTGAPDNVFLIGGMYTIFDAKSPKNPAELSNFPTYISDQAKHINKYIKHDDVRKDAFLVVPTNALSSLDTFMYQLEGCTVYVITLEAVLPILQMLRVLESYEFAEKLSPEDRDKLCRFIGRLTHTAKRNIQIETYLSHEMIDALQDANSLPEEFLKEVNQFDKKAVLNPPIERRSKLIKVEDVAEDVKNLENKIVGWSVIDD